MPKVFLRLATLLTLPWLAFDSGAAIVLAHPQTRPVPSPHSGIQFSHEALSPRVSASNFTDRCANGHPHHQIIELFKATKAPGTWRLNGQRRGERRFLNRVVKNAKTLETAKAQDLVARASKLARSKTSPLAEPLDARRVVIHTLDLPLLGLPRFAGAKRAKDLVYVFARVGADGKLHCYVSQRYWQEHLLRNVALLAEHLDHEWAENVNHYTHRQAAERAWGFAEGRWKLSPFHFFILDRFAIENDKKHLHLLAVRPHPNDVEGLFAGRAWNLFIHGHELERKVLRNGHEGRIPSAAEYWASYALGTRFVFDDQRAAVTEMVDRLLPKTGQILDIMSGEFSIFSRARRHVLGIGALRETLVRNPVLHDFKVHDFNEDPQIPTELEFAAAVISFGISYLEKVTDVLRDLYAHLAPGGRLIVAYAENAYDEYASVNVWRIPSYYRFVSRAELLKSWLVAAGFKHIQQWDTVHGISVMTAARPIRRRAA